MSHQTFFPTSNKVDDEVGMVLCLKISTFAKQTPVQDTLSWAKTTEFKKSRLISPRSAGLVRQAKVGFGVSNDEEEEEEKEEEEEEEEEKQ